MAVRELRYFEDKTLRRKSRAVEKVDGIILRLLEDMAETMYAKNGVGLAAPQVGINKRVIVVDIGEELYKVINPKIVKREGLVEATEGCLSLPNYFGEVDRAETITVRGMDESGEIFKLDAEGMLARVFQHEIDHLEGTLFIDKARNVREVKPEDQVCATAEEGDGEAAQAPHPAGQVLTCLEERGDA